MIDLKKLEKENPDHLIQIKVSDLLEYAKCVNLSNSENNKKTISAEEACEMIGVNRVTLWRYKHQGYLSPIKVGGKLRYYLSDVEQFLNGGQHGTSSNTQ